MTQDQEQKSKEFISLAQASKISGYHQDYLGFLCRSGKLEGFKLGRNWVTTQVALDSFLANYKNGISEVIDESGKKIQVHVVSDKQSSLLPVTVSSLPEVTNQQISVAPQQTPQQIVQLSGLKRAVLEGIETRVKNLSDKVAEIELSTSAEAAKSKPAEEMLPVVVRALAQPNPGIEQKFSSNFGLSNPEPVEVLAQHQTTGLTSVKIKDLYNSFIGPAQSNLRLIYAVGAIALVGLFASVLSSNWIAQSGNPTNTEIVYQGAQQNVIDLKGQTETNNGDIAYANPTSTPQNIIVNKTVNQLLGFSGTDIYSLIDDRLNQYFSRRKI